MGQTYHNTLSTMLDSTIKHITLHILIRIQDIDPRHLVDPTNIRKMLRIRLHSRIKEIRLIRDQRPQIPHLIRLERIHGIRLRLGRKERRHNPIVHDHHRATAFCLFVRSDSHGLQEVHGAVGGEGGGRAHGAHEDDGLIAVDCCVEEEGGFLEGIGAVGYDGAGHRGVSADKVVDGVGDVEEEGRGDVAAADVGGLQGGDVGLGEDLGG